jgi:hypothetical protein
MRKYFVKMHGLLGAAMMAAAIAIGVVTASPACLARTPGPPGVLQTAQADDPARVLRRQQQFTATVQALRTLEALLASATFDDDARGHIRSQLDALLGQYAASHRAELKIARLRLEMRDIREKQGGAISGGNIEVFADQERRLRQRELEILLEIRELEREIAREKQ